ncbi:hypothetical protein ACFY71_40355 [Streptomyces cinerochromogenes]|uniref:hypothetical protein n=1 Tax=Streptomyces cinerochromogenes TaxID=66422 RepID=UPI0036BCFB53
MRARISKMQQRVVRGVQVTPLRLRRWASAVDVWVQDHHIAVVVTMFILLGAAAVLLLGTHWIVVVDLARQLAPVLTIFSITASAILGTARWLRKRRVARLARNDTETVQAAVPDPPANTDSAHGDAKEEETGDRA